MVDRSTSMSMSSPLNIAALLGSCTALIVENVKCASSVSGVVGADRGLDHPDPAHGIGRQVDAEVAPPRS